jgi:hypothetical protein
VAVQVVWLVKSVALLLVQQQLQVQHQLFPIQAHLRQQQVLLVMQVVAVPVLLVLLVFQLAVVQVKLRQLGL